MPTTHVLVALSSVAFTAASGHTLRAISRAPGPRVRQARARLQAESRHAPPRRGGHAVRLRRDRGAARVPPWHEEEGSPEERVKQLGLELDGRVATNRSGRVSSGRGRGRPRVRLGAGSTPHGRVFDRGEVRERGDDRGAGGGGGEGGRDAMLATMKQFGSLDMIKQVVKVNGFVNCEPDFTKQPAVVNGLANLLIEVFGPAGKASRSAVGCSGLPLGIPVGGGHRRAGQVGVYHRRLS